MPRQMQTWQQLLFLNLVNLTTKKKQWCIVYFFSFKWGVSWTESSLQLSFLGLLKVSQRNKSAPAMFPFFFWISKTKMREKVCCYSVRIKIQFLWWERSHYEQLLTQMQFMFLKWCKVDPNIPKKKEKKILFWVINVERFDKSCASTLKRWSFFQLF